MSGEKELLVSKTIEDFSEYIKISQARRAKPYIQGKCRLPKKYDTPDYHWVKKGKNVVLARVSDGLVLTANSKSAGTPRYKKVNGQDIYNGNVSRQARASLVKAIHQYFIPYLKDIPKFDDIDKFPLTLELQFLLHDNGKNNIDNDNKWIWRKCIQDTLTELGIIPDDNPHIMSKNSEETIFINPEVPQQLIINIYGNT